MNAKLTTRQLCFYAMAFLPAIKLITLPSALSYYAKNDLILAAAINALLSFSVIFLVMRASVNAKTTFFGWIGERFGKATLFAVRLGYLLFFLTVAFVLVLEQKNYVDGTFFDIPPSALGFMPFFFLSGYVCMQPLRAVGRSADFIFPLFAVSFLLLLAMSVGAGDFTAVLPIGFTPAKSVLTASARALVWFSDPVFLLFFVGEFKPQKGTVAKVLGAYTIGVLAFLLFLWVFFSVFSDTAMRQTFAVSKIAQYFTALSVIGRIDYAAIYVVTVTVLLQTLLPMQLSAQIILSFHKKITPFVASMAVNSLVGVAIILWGDYYMWVQQIVCFDLFGVVLLFGYLIPSAYGLIEGWKYAKNKG